MEKRSKQEISDGMLAPFYSPFPEVAESVQEELDSYRAQEDEVKHLKSIMVRHNAQEEAEPLELHYLRSKYGQVCEETLRTSLTYTILFPDLTGITFLWKKPPGWSRHMMAGAGQRLLRSSYMFSDMSAGFGGRG